MIIVDHQTGQLANRLWHFTHFLANSLEYHFRLVYRCFNDYSDCFEGTRQRAQPMPRVSLEFSGSEVVNRQIERCLTLCRRRPRLARRLAPFVVFHNLQALGYSNRHFPLSDPAFLRLARRRIVVAEGWTYNDQDSVIKHGDSIRTIFTPAESFRRQVRETMAGCRQAGQVVIGVHLRRGDYKDFNGGRWYYPNAVYADKMRQMRNVLSGRGQSCVFLLCSNEPVVPDDFAGLTIRCGERPAVVDLYSLAQCDYLLGPPSTFTPWASFYGQVPFFVIDQADAVVDETTFRIVYEGTSDPRR